MHGWSDTDLIPNFITDVNECDEIFVIKLHYNNYNNYNKLHYNNNIQKETKKLLIVKITLHSILYANCYSQLNDEIAKILIAIRFTMIPIVTS